MSDLAAAAAAMGLPESLVQRSAAARAAETGVGVDEIIAAWAGGAPPRAAAPPEPIADEPVASDAGADRPKPEELASVIETEVKESPASAADAVPAVPYRAPVLVGVSDRPMMIVSGSVVLFAMILVMGLIGPSLQIENPGARTSRITLSETGREGQGIYMSLGCAACHTQMVRPVVADVGLGAVTLNDSNQVLGSRRFGPDLSNVGVRHTRLELEAIVEGGGGAHPPYSLTSDDMEALVTYLRESITASEESGQPEENT